MDKTKKPRRIRAKRVGVGLGALLVLALAGVGLYRYERPVPLPSITAVAPTLKASTVTLPFTASGKSSIETLDGKRLGQGINADVPAPTASIAKLITILTVLKKYPINAGESGPTITLTQSDVDRQKYYAAIDGSNVPVMAGEQITEYQMLQAMLLPSANNIADSLAIWAYGSLKDYRNAAQDMVNGMGMAHTVIGSDASGFLPDTTSTANDLVLLGRTALAQSVIREIASQRIAVIPVAGTIYSTNVDLGTDGVNGLKTGTSDQAGNCYLFSATHTFNNGQTETFVGAIMGSASDSSRFTEAENLLSATYGGYREVPIVSNRQNVGTITSAWGQHADIVANSDLDAFAWSGDSQASSIKITNKSTSYAAGSTVGVVASGSETVPIVTSSPISGPSWWWRILH